MIKRIVKMSFHPEKVGQFTEIFETNWQKIRSFEGCSHVELLQDENNSGIFFTYSLWLSEEHVNRYRDSELFAQVWGATKKLFNAKPEAWSVREVTFDK
jgi:heme oxygenase (mycobilin-producing)